MERKKRTASPEREAMKSAVLAAVANDSWLALDVGEVLVSIGSAMMKAGGTSEVEFLEYARRSFAAQQRLPSSSSAS